LIETPCTLYPDHTSTRRQTWTSCLPPCEMCAWCLHPSTCPLMSPECTNGLEPPLQDLSPCSTTHTRCGDSAAPRPCGHVSVCAPLPSSGTPLTCINTCWWVIHDSWILRVPHISLSVWCSLETSAELLPSVMWATRQRKWCHMPSRLLCSTARTCWPCIKPTTGMSDHPSRATHRVVGMVHWQSALLYLNDANNPFQSTPRLVFVSEAIPTTKPLPAPSAPLNIHS
jgi:hypothetical protein